VTASVAGRRPQMPLLAFGAVALQREAARCTDHACERDGGRLRARPYGPIASPPGSLAEGVAGEFFGLRQIYAARRLITNQRC
jgi:hypothetical protein